MGTPDLPDADALLVLCLWRQDDGSWRVRITRSTHRGRRGPEPTYASTRPEVMRAVDEWFDRAVTPS